MMKKPTPWIVLLVAIIAGASWYFFKPQAPEEHPSVAPLPVTEDTPAEPQVSYPVADIPVTGDAPVEPLPALADSDELLLEVLNDWFEAPDVERYFVTEQLVSRIVTTIDSLDSRQLAPLVMPVRPPAGGFRVLEGEAITIHPDNALRYTPYVRMVSMVDTQLLADRYVRYYPLFQQAYEELGHADRQFNDRLVEIIDHLLSTPRLDSRPVLVKPEAVYLFGDPDLEALSAGQKLLLRIGADNAEIVLDKLREIRAAVTR